MDKYTRLNPSVKSPFLRIMARFCDAQAIMVYLARKYDKTNHWYPDNAEAMGRINQWLSTGGEVMNSAGARPVKTLNYPLDLKLQAGANRCSKSWTPIWRSATGWSWASHHRRYRLLSYTAMAGEGGSDLAPYPNILKWIGRMKRILALFPMPGVPAAARRRGAGVS